MVLKGLIFGDFHFVRGCGRSYNNQFWIDLSFIGHGGVERICCEPSNNMILGMTATWHQLSTYISHINIG